MSFSIFYHKLSELNGDSILKEKNLSAIKKLTDILVIDDKDFTFLEALRKYEFCIQQKYDLTHLSDVEAYDIILCDIRGVGKFLESDFEGANLIKELKTKYPNKTILAYTANEYDANFQKYLDYADGIIPKGSYGLEDWVSLLNDTLEQCANPVAQWERTRKMLLKANVSTIDVAKYESQYVKAIKSGSFESFTKLYGNTNKIGANIMIDLTSSIIAKLLKNKL